MKKNILFLGFILFNTFVLFGQDRKCANLDVPKYFDREFMQKAMQTYLPSQSGRVENQTYVIPVIFHLCYTESPSSATRLVSQTQIQSQIEVLNEDYNRRNPDTVNTRAIFKSVAAAANIRFELANLAPDGSLLAEKGIVRHKIGKGNWAIAEFRNSISTQTIWNPNQYLNVWVLDTLIDAGQSYLGHAQFPDLAGLMRLNNFRASEKTDGVLVIARVLGSVAKEPALRLSPSFAYGRILTHEIGHFLGLLHTFHFWGRCSQDPDDCEDTPTALQSSDRWVRTCDQSYMACDQLVMHENFMDYTEDICLNIFTQCQVRQMRWILENAPRRKELWSSKTVLASVADPLENAIKVFPDPVTDRLSIQMEKDMEIRQTQLFNIWGKKISELLENQTDNYSICLPLLPKGVYFLRLETKQGWLVKKILFE